MEGDAGWPMAAVVGEPYLTTSLLLPPLWRWLLLVGGRVIQNIIDHVPKLHYLVAVDESIHTLEDLVKVQLFHPIFDGIS